MVAATAVALLAGCTSTVQGTASPAPTSATTSPGSTATATPSAAPTGQVTPAPAVGPGTGAEARRIAAVTSLIPLISPERTGSCFPSGPFGSASGVDGLYFGDGRVGQELDRWGFVAGWGNCGQDAANNGTLLLVAEMSDPDSAAAAADTLNGISLELESGGYEPVDLPDLGVTGALSTGGSDSAGAPTDTVQVWVPSGRMLAYAYLDAPAGGAPDLVTRQLTDQLGLLQGFAPTPQDQVPGLPTDPLGLAPFAVQTPGDATRFTGSYDLEGYLRLAIDPVVERQLLTANGFSGAYYRTSYDEAAGLDFAVSLYTFPTSAQTNAVYTGFAQLEATAFGGTAFALPAIPEAPCFAFDGGGGSFYQRCYVGYGSYLASIDVLGLAAADDYAQMNTLLPQQRDLIDG
ncbi:DUF7373 family lipoprotein [Klenkia brasiliensis]|uniref:DUF7373 domain-containing protein n=1 Tax=Klenkia brasiliensis TaxID=333142 RepID=A0A1G7R7X1_9ACTN|nr:hypothetical protein [Klenkia brasiliensis]SDG06279.1 hypothetical protein SAMN05660324_1771 [Klenkia brasiliensis]